MFGRSFFRSCAIVASLALIAGSVAAHAQDQSSSHLRKYKAPPPSARIEVTVLKADNGKPVQAAHVIFHPIEGDKDKGSMELKTNEDGKINIDVIPMGDTVRLQIIADGFQTYGQDYHVDRPKLAWEVCLRRPSPQYSIYTNHPTSLGASSCPDNVSHQNSGSGGAASDNPPSSTGAQDAAPGATPSQPKSN